MIPSAFIDEYPCERGCEHVKVIHDVPPFTRCRLSLTGDFECVTIVGRQLLAVARVSERAEQVATLIAREPDRRLRAEEAREIADAFANTFYELGAGFDDEMFYRACHVLDRCRACEERTPDDSYTRLCESCEPVAVAV